MNKKKVKEYLNYAYEAIKLSEILDKKTKKVKKSFRSQISAFGASISMGSPKAAIAFFSKQGKSETERPKLLYAIYLTLNKHTENTIDNKNGKNANEEKTLNKKCCEAAEVLFKELDKSYSTEDIINATIAVKLAMNLYELDDN